MKVFEATMRVVHMETWTVDAINEEDARKKFSKLADSVETDKTGGEVIDWELYDIKELAQSEEV